MSVELSKRLQRIYAALGDAKSDDETAFPSFVQLTDREQSLLADYSQGRSTAELENVAYTLITTIASIKDHLKKWCKANGIKFGGDDLINTDQNVALVHDLWNIDKHADLDRQPRSGHVPTLVELSQSLRLSGGSEPGSFVALTFNRFGKPEFVTAGNAARHLVVDAVVVDENGQRLGKLLNICDAAIKAWEGELLRSGVRIAI